MRVNELYSYDNSKVTALKYDESAQSSSLKAGDILEGIVSSVGSSTKVSFEQLNNRELSFDSGAVKNAYVGEKRRFEVVSAASDKLVLRDLGGIAAEADARAALSAKVDSSMPQMVEDFEETQGLKEKEDNDEIKNLSDEDYAELAAEGFSIEDFKAEHLIRAIERIKTGRALKKESLDMQSENIKQERKNIKKQAAAAAAGKYSEHQNIVDALLAADLPITDENVAGILNAMAMSAETGNMNENAHAYIIRNELAPTVSNIYKSVYSGSIKRTEINPEDWAAIAPKAQEIVEEANKAAGEPIVTVRDAKRLMEYDIPVNEENLIYRHKLEQLTIDRVLPEEVARAAARAVARGERPEDAVLIEEYEPESEEKLSGPIEQLLGALRLQETRIMMSTGADAAAKAVGIGNDIGSIEEEISRLKNEIRSFYEELAGELSVGDITPEKLDIAAETSLAVEKVAAAPVTLYGATFEYRTTITLQGLADEAQTLLAGKATASYEASATEIRKDLGDSIGKAFGSIDSLLEQAGMESTEANVRAVKILGHNSMEITPQNIENIKYYDAKVTSMVEGMKPAIVMALIKKGFNPLEQDIDTINKEIRELKAEEGISDEERFSTFLVKLEANNDISEQARDAYIGIYRLLYQIEKSDGAAIGALIGSGRKLTLKNLLTESRSRSSGGIEASIDDVSEISHTVYGNSISDQIENAFIGLDRERFSYNMQMTDKAISVTEPKAWDEAFGDTSAGELSEYTLEDVAEKLNLAEAYTGDSGIAQAAMQLRSVMGALSGSKSFLKAIGAEDSARNISLMDREGEDLALEYNSRDELIGAVENSDNLIGRYEDEALKAQNDAEAEFLGEIAIISKGKELQEQLDKYSLLAELAGRQHYRMKTGGDTPARVNLTIIRDAGRAGTMSLEVSTTSYHVRADLSITIFGGEGTGPERESLSGSLNLDSPGEQELIREPLESFVQAVTAMGIEAGGITVGAQRMSPGEYLSRLGELKMKAENRAAAEPGNTRKVRTSRLYAVAKEFIAKFI